MVGTMERILRLMAERKASDIYLSAHSPALIRINGNCLPINAQVLPPEAPLGLLSEVVEGVVIEENSVLSMGVFISQSTKIYNRETGEILYGRVPSGSVVVPGSLPSADGKYSMYAAIIVKKVDAKTRSTTSLNDLLRD